MEIYFWVSLGIIIYSYIGYPLILYVLDKFIRGSKDIYDYKTDYEPSVSIIIPVYNEDKIIEKKIINTISLNYPEEKHEVLIISDASKDKTEEIVQRNKTGNIKFFDSTRRKGKAAALNLGLKNVKNEIIVFSDVSIMLDRDALKNIVKKFQNQKIGCISGQDHIREAGGEGLYGKYELYLRDQESKIHSIVGASGSFYAQRRRLCKPFKEGMAPDFLSVLRTVEKGYRAVNEPMAYGAMTSLKSAKDEFNRKTRTVVRGMTTLFHKKKLLNPIKYGIFSFELLSHKLVRWTVPFFLISLFISNFFLLEVGFYMLTFYIQLIFYLVAIMSLIKYRDIHKKLWSKIPLYFLTVNASILFAWFKYLSGVRQEIWNPSKRII